MSHSEKPQAKGKASRDSTGKATTSSEVDKNQQTSSDAGTLQEESGPTDEEKANDERLKRFQRLAEQVPLYQAALKGNWQEAKDVHDKYPGALQRPITEANETALHIAATTKWTTFVKELLKHMNENDLKHTNNNKQTALYFAAASGNVKIAKQIVKKSKELTLIRSSKKRTPLYVAALLGRREMVSYLFSVTPFEELSPCERIQLFVVTISNDLYDIALKILKKDSSLANATTHGKNKKTALQELARKPLAIGSKSRLSVWKQCLNSWFKWIYDKALMQTLARQLVEDLWKNIRPLPDKQFSYHVDSVLFRAAETGNVELLIILFRSYPDLIWKTDEKRRTIFHVAVLNRQEAVFNLINEIGAIKDMILVFADDKNQNIAHLAGKMAPSSRLNMVSGEALQMQLELLWFKEVEKIVQPSFLKKRSAEGKTPRDLFTYEHKDLKTRGETWMKDTANYCMLVATLIATVVFTAAFTVPGGNNQDTGIPIFLKSKWFMVFFISDVIALLSSSTAILMFLSILTSRYAEDDFLYALPRRLVVGLTALFLSIAGMILAFTATCFLVFKNEMTWLPIVTIVVAGVPVILFVSLHCQLWIDTVRSTYWSMFLFRPLIKRRLFSG